MDTASGMEDDTPDTTHRYDGGVMIISIYYDNTGTWNQNNITYEIRVRLLPNTDYKYVETRPINDANISNATVIENRHGILLVLVQTGKLGHFDFATLIVQLTAALGLLAVTNAVIDLLAMHVLAQKEQYSEAMVQKVGNFTQYIPLVHSASGDMLAKEAS
eukprot:NODE_1235_length_637_cov_296.892996_g1225_i0.p1 GENE.NODE_1235_length_637_cov_296.892996_g1225_i0~~NODE_1235_length_637_cov_296.892996_g1225_i0.p1  ORF type:complete len:178 (+),score=16.83 NODE_1235_length_637_cov_296.892996_g1225_i0:53-535(+)